MRHLPTLFRQVRRASPQAGLFVLCVALSLTTLTAISGFTESVARTLREDARALHAADVIVRAHEPLSAPLSQAIDQLAEQGRIRRVNVHEFHSVVRAADETASVLSRLKVVEPGYPFYGEVVLKSGRPFHQALVPGSCIVEPSLLVRTGREVGDLLKIGHTALRISDVVTAEPDRPLELFALGPRIFIHAADLEALGLLATGSRIRHLTLIQVMPPHRADAIAARLKQASATGDEQIDTYLTASSAVKRFLDNFLFFLKLVGLFILMISGLGIQSTLTALFNEHRPTVAIMKAVGADERFIAIHFSLLTLVLGAAGTGGGILAGAALQAALVWALGPLLAVDLAVILSWRGIFEAIGLGVVVVALFSFVPLHRLKALRPVTILVHQPAETTQRWPVYVVGLLLGLWCLVLVRWHMGELRFGFYFVLAIGGMILAAALLAQLALGGLRRLPVRHLVLRQAIRGLFRRGNATRTVVVTLTVSLAVIFGDHLIERNLYATFVRAFPAASPNAFFVDIQPDQTEAFAAAIDGPVAFFPIVRARVTAINGQTVDRGREDRKRRDNLSRVFNLTYRDNLLDDETILQGGSLFRRDWDEIQVSVMDRVVEMHPMGVGDRIEFNIQGVPLTARIASIRTRDNHAFSPFFYFVFPTAVLGKAPQTLFAALKVPADQMGSLQNRIVSRFPNISVMDISQIIGTFAGLMTQLAGILRLLSLFCIVAGILILVSAILATRAERMVEAVYYKILGAERRFIFAIFAVENLMIGLLSSTLAMAMAQAAAWWVCTVRFDIAYRPFLTLTLPMAVLPLVLVVTAGMAASRSILAKKPVIYLKEQRDG